MCYICTSFQAWIITINFKLLTLLAGGSFVKKSSDVTADMTDSGIVYDEDGQKSVKDVLSSIEGGETDMKKTASLPRNTELKDDKTGDCYVL